MAVERFDRDGYGRISRQEFEGPPQKFQSSDSIGDGFLTRAKVDAGKAWKKGGGGAASARLGPGAGV